MNISLLALFGVAYLVGLVLAAPFNEGSDVVHGMKDARERATAFGPVLNFKRHGDEQITPSTDNDEGEGLDKPEAKPHSFYTRNIKSKSGGKATVTEQYRHHLYTPPPVQVVPEEIQPSGDAAADEARRHLPKGPVALGTEILFTP